MHVPRPSRAHIASAVGVVAIASAPLAAVASASAATSPAGPNLSTASVKSGWQFPVPNWSIQNKEAGRVDDTLRIGNVVYIAGDFTLTGDHSGTTATRTYLAAQDATTGALLSFAPVLNGRAYALATSPDHSKLYVGGQFTTVNGKKLGHLVAFDLATGNVSPVVPDLGINGTVKAITQSGSDLYVGGAFTSIGGQAHVRLAKLTQAGSGAFAVNPSFTASASDEVRDIIADAASQRVIVAGWFKTINGQAGQAHLTALSMATGATTTWANHPGSEVLDIARCGTSLYAAMGGPGGTALAYDLATGKQRWFYKTDGNVQAVTTVRGYPVYGMHGDYVAPQANVQMAEYGKSARIGRHKVFELTPNGQLTSWAPALTSTDGVLGVWALGSGQGSLYVGGDFTKVSGVDQARFAIFQNAG